MKVELTIIFLCNNCPLILTYNYPNLTPTQADEVRKDIDSEYCPTCSTPMKKQVKKLKEFY